MDSPTLVVGVTFILHAAGFALVFASLVPRGQLALVPHCPVFPPQPRAHPFESILP